MSGDFETHVTVPAAQAEQLAAFATEHGVAFVHIELDRGTHPAQPMLTLRGSGTLTEVQAEAETWCAQLRDQGMHPVRVKIEATPWATGVPQHDGDTTDRYFEHHVKVLLPPAGEAELAALTDLAGTHGARLSRNARRHRPGGAQERFVNQRCSGVGRATATRRLDELVAALRAGGHEVVAVEQEYVVHDTRLALDEGWLEPVPVTPPRPAVSRSSFPPTYRPLPESAGVAQHPVFDPAVKQYARGFRASEPAFTDPAAGERWYAARRAAMTHLLTVVAGTRWAGHLVLRGSVTLPAWLGDGAREPGDVDFVVTPATITSDSAEARELLDGITTALAAHPGAGLRPEETVESAIWTYERADGRRLVVPFRTSQVPDGSVQVDVVFGESLPIAPEPLDLPGLGRPVLAATAGLSLIWKLLWLFTDAYPQGKDLYDAVLLAEHTTVDWPSTRELLRPELGAEVDHLVAGSVLFWPVDWAGFTDEYPAVTGSLEQWLRRLAVALERGMPKTG